MAMVLILAHLSLQCPYLKQYFASLIVDEHKETTKQRKKYLPNGSSTTRAPAVPGTVHHIIFYPAFKHVRIWASAFNGKRTLNHSEKLNPPLALFPFSYPMSYLLRFSSTTTPTFRIPFLPFHSSLPSFILSSNKHVLLTSHAKEKSFFFLSTVLEDACWQVERGKRVKACRAAGETP